jgi:hypothetical protein
MPSEAMSPLRRRMIEDMTVRKFVEKTQEGGIGLRGQPVADAMWLEVGLFFKKRPTERCEMFGTMPRRIASSAISRWLQWLIGRSLSDGFSQVIAIKAQICSGVYTAGAPDRGASDSRSGTDRSSAASRQRLRQYRTVFGHTPSSRPLSRTRTPSAACKMMRARSANCCGVEWTRTSRSKTSRCLGKTITTSAVNRGAVSDSSCHSPRDSTPVLMLRMISNQHTKYLHAQWSQNLRLRVPELVGDHQVWAIARDAGVPFSGMALGAPANRPRLRASDPGSNRFCPPPL